jgi:hypothetical protein
MWQIVLIWGNVGFYHRLIGEGRLIDRFWLEHLWLFSRELTADVLDFLIYLSRCLLNHKVLLLANWFLVLAEPIPKLVILNASFWLELAEIGDNCSEYFGVYSI